MKIKELIEKLQKYNPEEEIVTGDGSNGFYEIEQLLTVRDCIIEEELDDFCESFDINPNTITIISELC